MDPSEHATACPDSDYIDLKGEKLAWSLFCHIETKWRGLATFLELIRLSAYPFVAGQDHHAPQSFLSNG
jgi:hypothetical protein